jgi:hypothetical protein
VRGEKKRVEEVHSEGMVDQGKKSVLILEEFRQKNEERERKLTWELEEEKRKNLREGRKVRGIEVKDQLSRESAITKRLSARNQPRYRNHSMHRSPDPRAVSKSGVQGEETVVKKPASTMRRANNNHGRRACTSGTGRSEASHTDYRLRGPGADKIVVHKF